MSAPLLPDSDFIAAVENAAGQEKSTGAPHTAQANIFQIAFGAVVGFALLLILVFVVYLERTLPGAWFPDVNSQTWDAQHVTLARGVLLSDRSSMQQLAFQTDDTGMAVIVIDAQFSAAQYPALDFDVGPLPDGGAARLIWRNDLRPNERAQFDLQVDENGRIQTAVLTGHKSWFGNISGLALAVQLQPKQIFSVRGVSANPMGAGEALRRLLDGWLRFSPWTGTSIAQINDAQPPLSHFVVLALLLPVALVTLLLSWRAWRRQQKFSLPVSWLYVGMVFLLSGWLILDARWGVQLIQQAAQTQKTYGSKTITEKHLAAVDAPLFAFIEKARVALPQEPARVFALAPDPYLRSRIAYHLYPHNVYFDFYSAAPPAARVLRPGDYVLSFQQSGIQYDVAQKKMRWPDGTELAAEIKVVEAGSALIEVQ